MLGQTSRMNSSYKRSSYKHMSENKWVLSLIEFYNQQDVSQLHNTLLATDIMRLHYIFPISELLVSNCLASNNSNSMLKITST